MLKHFKLYYPFVSKLQPLTFQSYRWTFTSQTIAKVN